MVDEAEIRLNGVQYLVRCELGENRAVGMQVKLNSKQLEISHSHVGSPLLCDIKIDLPPLMVDFGLLSSTIKRKDRKDPSHDRRHRRSLLNYLLLVGLALSSLSRAILFVKNLL